MPTASRGRSERLWSFVVTDVGVLRRAPSVRRNLTATADGLRSLANTSTRMTDSFLDNKSRTQFGPADARRHPRSQVVVAGGLGLVQQPQDLRRARAGRPVPVDDVAHPRPQQ